MSRDHYAVLGVSPTSEDVVIRAAYRALMLRYHPDADPSSEASRRAQAINAAYAVLGDPDKRARYDGSLAAQGLIKPDAPYRSSLARRMVPGPAGLVGLVALAATATMLALSPPIGVLPEDGLPLSSEPRPARAVEAERPASASSSSPEHPIAEAIAPSTAVPATKEVPNAMLEPPEQLVAPEPPAQPAVQAARTETGTPTPASVTIASKRRASKPPVVQSAGKPPAVAAEAAGDCRLGDGWADRAICGSNNLTALDRQHGLLYAQSWAKADQAKRAALLGSRERFREKRNACRSEGCLTGAYVARLREISDIMARDGQE